MAGSLDSGRYHGYHEEGLLGAEMFTSATGNTIRKKHGQHVRCNVHVRTKYSHQRKIKYHARTRANKITY